MRLKLRLTEVVEVAIALTVATLLTGRVARAADGIPEPESQVVAPSTPEHPRNGEGDIIVLKNGDLLLVYGRWYKSGSDFGQAELWSKTSHDGGKT